MKPAVCFLYGKTAVDEPLDNKGDWVEFADFQQNSSVGLDHPNGLEYVCGEHISAANQLKNKITSAALLNYRRNMVSSMTSTIINLVQII